MDFDLYEKIEAYLKGRMPDEEQQQFEQDIAKDEELKAVVSIQKDAMAATAESDIIALREQLGDLFKKENEKEEPDHQAQRIPSGFKSWWLLVLLPLMALLFWWFTTAEKAAVLPATTPPPAQEEKAPLPPPPANMPIAETADNKATTIPPVPATDSKNEPKPVTTAPATNEYLALAETNFPNPQGVLVRSEKEGKKSKLEKAQDAYDQGIAETDPDSRQAYFAKCITLLDELDDTQLIPARYLRANAYFQIGEYNKAAVSFATLSDDFEYGYDADWGHLLALIAQGDTQKEAYTQVLQKITQDANHSFRQKALELKEELKRLEK